MSTESFVVPKDPLVYASSIAALQEHCALQEKPPESPDSLASFNSTTFGGEEDKRSSVYITSAHGPTSFFLSLDEPVVRRGLSTLRVYYPTEQSNKDSGHDWTRWTMRRVNLTREDLEAPLTSDVLKEMLELTESTLVNGEELSRDSWTHTYFASVQPSLELTAAIKEAIGQIDTDTALRVLNS